MLWIPYHLHFVTVLILLLLNIGRHHLKLTKNQVDKERWNSLHEQIQTNAKKYLWDAEKMKFIPHIYIDGSPFPDDFDENAKNANQAVLRLFNNMIKLPEFQLI